VIRRPARKMGLIMINKSALNLWGVGITATIVLVSAILLKLFSSVAAAEVSGGETNENSTSSTSVIVLSSLEKVLQDDVNVRGAKEAEIFCAKNEYESFQIIIVNPTDKPIPQINLKADNWHFTGTPGEGSPELTLYREHYIKVTQSSYKLKSKSGMYPDALIPFIDPYTGKEIVSGKYLAKNQDVQPHKSQGYWIDVHVGSDIKAGIYTNEIKVLAGGQVIKRIPVKLTVWDFTLPKQRKFITYMNGFYDMHQYYGLQKPEGPDYDTLMNRYMDMSFEHGIYPEFQLSGYHYTKQENAAKEGKPAGTVTFSPLYHSNIKTFISKYGTGIIQIPPSWLLTNYEVPSAKSVPTREEVKRTLQCYNDMSKAHPEYGQYVVYLDEPWTQNRKDAVKTVKDIMNEIPDLKLKMMLTGSQYAFDTKDSSGNRCADLWICYGPNVIDDHIHTPSVRRSLEDLTSDFLNDSHDKILWTINSKGFIDANLSAYRDFAWYGYTLGMTGGLNWKSTLRWTQGAVDSWVESRTYTNPELPSRVYNGAYFFIYHGTPDRVGISGIGGPIASMRLKTWQKACEDFEYFKMLEGLTDKATVDAIVSNVVKDYYTCAKPEDYATARKTIAKLILQHLKND